MNAVIEINRPFSDPSGPCARDLAVGFIRNPGSDCGSRTISGPGGRQEPCDIDAGEVSGAVEQACGATGGRLKAWGETVGFSLAILVVIGLGTLGGWAVMLVLNSLAQAQSLVVQNSFVFHR